MSKIIFFPEEQVFVNEKAMVLSLLWAENIDIHREKMKLDEGGDASPKSNKLSDRNSNSKSGKFLLTSWSEEPMRLSKY